MALPGDVDELLPALVSVVQRLLTWLGGDGNQVRARTQCRHLALARYSWPQIVDRLEHLYRDALSDVAAGPSTRPC